MKTIINAVGCYKWHLAYRLQKGKLLGCQLVNNTNIQRAVGLISKIIEATTVVRLFARELQSKTFVDSIK